MGAARPPATRKAAGVSATSAAARLLVLSALVGFTFLGCGKKGPPVAPERRLPAAASGLSASVEGPAIVVRWTNPRQRLDSTALRDLTVVKLHRREEMPDLVEPKAAMLSWGRVVGYEEIASILLTAPAPAGVQRGAVTWIDRAGLSFGRRYVYVVTVLDATGRSSPPSERLAVSFLAAPGPPLDLVAGAGDGRVRLSWNPPASLIDGTAVTDEIRYVVLRGTGAEGATGEGPTGVGPMAPLTAEPLSASSFTDTGLENETTYRYAVRAVRVGAGGARALGAPSAAATATPVDTTPPSPPTGLVAVPSASAVRLAWNPSPDADVALYAVYRATGGGGFARIGTTPAVNTVFIDREVAPGTAYRYAVTALDRARTPNESARSNEVSVTPP